MADRIAIIGAGMAGCEAALFLAERGIDVELYEMKPGHYSPAHKSPDFCELVCSNSLKASRLSSAAGLMKHEMRMLGSHLLPVADTCAVPAGGALAVDRKLFSGGVTELILREPHIKVIREKVTDIDESRITVIAAGPLLDSELAETLGKLTDGFLSFYDAAAPIVTRDSVDMEKLHAANRYGKGGEDYLNSFMNKEQYERFIDELVHARRAELHEHDKDQKVYEGCMPIEKLAERGLDAARFGPMKPVGLRDPDTGHRPWAAVQLRKENEEGTMFNIVGFQTNLAFPEQRRVFGLLPGLENAEFVRYGVMHRNSFIDSPKVLSRDQSLVGHPNIYVAGQLTGFEGYMESALSGLIAARSIYARLMGREFEYPPVYTMTGAMLRYIHSENKDFQPMGANMGLLPDIGKKIRDKQERYEAYAQRAVKYMEEYIEKEDSHENSN